MREVRFGRVISNSSAASGFSDRPRLPEHPPHGTIPFFWYEPDERWDPGPWPGVQGFIAERAEFEVDRSRELFGRRTTGTAS